MLRESTGPKVCWMFFKKCPSFGLTGNTLSCFLLCLNHVEPESSPQVLFPTWPSWGPVPLVLFSSQWWCLTNINREEKYFSYVQIIYCFEPTKPLSSGALEILPIWRPMGYRTKNANRWVDSVQIIKSQKTCLAEKEEFTMACQGNLLQTIREAGSSRAPRTIF